MWNPITGCDGFFEPIKIKLFRISSALKDFLNPEMIL